MAKSPEDIYTKDKKYFVLFLWSWYIQTDITSHNFMIERHKWITHQRILTGYKCNKGVVYHTVCWRSDQITDMTRILIMVNRKTKLLELFISHLCDWSLRNIFIFRLIPTWEKLKIWILLLNFAIQMSSAHGSCH